MNLAWSAAKLPPIGQLSSVNVVKLLQGNGRYTIHRMDRHHHSGTRHRKRGRGVYRVSARWDIAQFFWTDLSPGKRDVESAIGKLAKTVFGRTAADEYCDTVSVQQATADFCGPWRASCRNSD